MKCLYCNKLLTLANSHSFSLLCYVNTINTIYFERLFFQGKQHHGTLKQTNIDWEQKRKQCDVTEPQRVQGQVDGGINKMLDFDHLFSVLHSTLVSLNYNDDLSQTKENFLRETLNCLLLSEVDFLIKLHLANKFFQKCSSFQLKSVSGTER